ncbi:Leucine-rich repeat [Sesbania bispinosa]|nr:Leucine-rich repeat [Sesbania bispinosa]
MQNFPILCLTIISLSLLHFLTNNFHVQALTLASDIAALKAFKASIKPSSIAPWSCLASWNFTTDPCAVPRRTYFTCGLTCTPDSTSINQITLDPAGSIPPSITTLKSLESLDLSHNSLSGSLPNSMNSLTNLRRIDLSFNKLTGSIPKLPPNLLELALKANSLSGPLQKSTFEGLNQLEVVELSENALAGTIESWFFQLPSLQQVDLANNSFTGIQISRPARGGGGSNLVAVNIGFNRIQGYAPANLAAYPLLSFLSIRHNSLRGTIPLEYGQIKSMKRLFLDGNFLIGKPPAGLMDGRHDGFRQLGGQLSAELSSVFTAVHAGTET